MPGGTLQEPRSSSKQRRHGKGPGGKQGEKKRWGEMGEKLPPFLFQSGNPQAVEIKTRTRFLQKQTLSGG